MDSHHAIDIVGYGPQPILRRMETRLTTAHHGVLNSEIVLAAKVIPVVMLIGWQYNNYAQQWVGLMETGNGVHEYRPPRDQHKLLGHGESHTESLTAGNYDYIVHTTIHFYGYSVIS